MSLGRGGVNATIATYYAGFHFVLGHGPFDSIDAVVISELEAWVGTSTGTDITINAPELFGGTAREGGVKGTLNVLMGLPAQLTNAYLVSKLGADIPAYRGLVSVIVKQAYLGNNYYFKPWAFLATRIHTRRGGLAQWQDALAEPKPHLINGVHVIRECLTDSTWGLGISEALIDETSFLTAAQVCYDEGLAFAWYWDSETTVQDFINDVEKHIQVQTYRDRITDKYHLTLVRNITSTVGLVELNESNIDSVDNFSHKSIGELTYSVTVKFTDNATYKENSVTITDSSLFQRQGGGGKSLTTTYSGVASMEVAQKLAARDQWQSAVPVHTCNITCDRTAENLNIGDAFVLNWPEYLTAPIVMRVLSINLGSATKQAISIEATGDFFYAAAAVYNVLPGTSWVSPITAPVAVTTRLPNEAPYYLVATQKGDAFAQAVATTDMYMTMAAVSPSSDSISAGLWTNSGGAYVEHGVVDFCCTALLTVATTRLDTTFTVGAVEDPELITVDHFIQVGNELAAVTSINYTGDTITSFTVVRGVLDTVPETHSIGDRIMAWHNFYTSDEVTYLLGETVNIKLTTITPKGELAIASAPPDSIVMAGRLHMPYPPCNVKLSSVYWPLELRPPVAATWATRNRIQQTAGLIGFYTGNVTTEAGVTYSGTMKRTDTMAVLDSFTAEAGTSHSLTAVYAGEVIVDIWAVRDGLDSFQHVTHTFILKGWDTLPATWDSWTSWT